MSRKKPASPRHKVTVEIAGEKHVLRSDVPPEYTRAVAEYLDGVVRALPGAASLEPHRALVLAALSITDELFRAREETRAARADARRRAGEAAEALERAVAEGEGDASDDGASEDEASGDDASEDEEEGDEGAG